MALTYKGTWALNTQYYIDDYVTDVSDDSGEGAGALLYCIVDNMSSSSNLTNDWDADFWSTRSGNNPYYNNNDSDGGPRLIEGTLAAATAVENKFTAVAKGFDQILIDTGAPLTLSALDYEADGRDFGSAVAERANKVLSFDANGSITAVSLKGEYRGNWTASVYYVSGDTVSDANNVFGYGSDSLLIASADHTSAGVGDTANWDVLIGTEDLDTAVAAAEASAVTAASEASDSAASALTSASEATDSAASALTSASEATDSAASALTSASEATDSAASATTAELQGWIAEAEALTADSYATEAEDTFVKTYASDGDGTFTATNTTEYSSLHWAAKSEGGSSGSVETVVGGTNTTVDATDAANPIVNVAFTPFDSRYLKSTDPVVVDGAIVEKIYAQSGTAIVANNGSMQHRTLTGAVTFTISIVNGQSITFQLINGATHGVTWPAAVNWVKEVPTLTDADILVFWARAGAIYGAYVGEYI